MFGQLFLWKDCSHGCTFCSQRDIRDNLTIADKRRRLMKASAWVGQCARAYDQFGLIGGELFEDAELVREWRCLADTISEIPAKNLFVTANLIGDTAVLEKYLELVPRTTICTSWDAVGRFHTPEQEMQWRENVERLHNMGYSICCTSILTQELMECEPDIPAYVHHTLLEPTPLWNYWYINADKIITSDRFIQDMSGHELHLPKRDDTLKWFEAHPEPTRHFADYLGTHSDDIYEFVDGNIQKTISDRFSRNRMECGHPRSMSCYADSPRCMMCDIKERFKW